MSLYRRRNQERTAPTFNGDSIMEFGICFDTHIDKWDLIRYAEELGYARAWVPDSQMICTGSGRRRAGSSSR